MQISMFSLEEHLASRSVSPACGKDLLTQGGILPSYILASLIAIAPSGFFGRTFPVSFPHGPVISRRVIWRKDKDGNLTKQVISAASSVEFSNSGMGSPTECLTLSTSELTALDGLSLKDDGVCSLSDILIGDAPQRYYLTPRACAGILRRAEKRGKDLPPTLLQALLAVAAGLSEAETPEDKILLSPLTA